MFTTIYFGIKNNQTLAKNVLYLFAVKYWVHIDKMLFYVEKGIS